MLGKRLSKGDTIGIVAPASFGDREKLEIAKENLEKFGYKVKLGKCTQNSYFSYSDTDYNRAMEINDLFKDREVDAIICMRGGYGSNKILEYIDFDIIKENPKIFVGYSDITTLHTCFIRKAGLITFHGPMAISNFSPEYNEDTYQNFINVVGGNFDGNIRNFEKELVSMNDKKAKGILVGGNLTTIIATLGTEYDVDYSGKILFLEDIGETTYKIDRFLNVLKKHGIFKKISGLILGEFTSCPKSDENDMSLEEVFNDYFKNLDIPILMNLESGHEEPMLTLPLGATVAIDGEKKTVQVLEKVVD